MFLILGIVFIQTIANSIYDVTGTYQRVNETFIANTSKVATLTYHPIVEGSLSTQNSSGTDVPLVNYTINYTAGTLLYTGSAAFNNTALLATYQNYPANYVYNSPSRAIINLITLLFAIALIIVLIVYAYVKVKDDLEDITHK